MRSLTLILFSSLLVASSAVAEEKLGPGVPVQAGNQVLRLDGSRGATPCMADFDGDGLNDLLVGHGEPGNLHIFRNAGTAKEPRFDKSEVFKIKNEIVAVPTEGAFRPQLADLNGDGQPDLVTTSWTGLIYWYRRISKNEFAEPEMLKLASGEFLIAGTDPTCCVVDWDGDGDLDLIIAGQGKPDAQVADVLFVENQGNRTNFSFATPKPILVDDKPLQSEQTLVFPAVGDWNRDGKPDLLLGRRDGSLIWYENIGDRRAPKLAAMKVLLESPLMGLRGKPKETPMRMWCGGLCVTDWNNDGTLDLLIGDSHQDYIRPDDAAIKKELATVREETANVVRDYRELRSINSRLNSETQAKQKEFARKKREALAKRIEELHAKAGQLEKSQQPRPDYHGYVWLFQR